VAGRILSFGKDQNGKSIDYGFRGRGRNDPAQIDILYAADVAQEPRLSSNRPKAGVKRAEADLGQNDRPKLVQAERD